MSSASQLATVPDSLDIAGKFGPAAAAKVTKKPTDDTAKAPEKAPKPSESHKSKSRSNRLGFKESKTSSESKDSMDEPRKSKRKHTDDDESKRKRSSRDHRDPTIRDSPPARRPTPPPSRAGRTKPTMQTPSGPMIIVTVNDRLGTKAQIPALPSDTIGDFKKLVAMKIGRKPHEIMVKRQSERPFKDMLTLEDYGVGHGVQLDLELDTGD